MPLYKCAINYVCTVLLVLGLFLPVDCWTVGQVGFHPSTYRENKLDLPLTSPSQNFSKFFFSFLFMILERVILNSWDSFPFSSQPSFLELRLQLLYFSLSSPEWALNACLSNLLHFSNNSLFEISQTLPAPLSCFLVLLTSPFFSGALPDLLCAPAIQKGYLVLKLHFSYLDINLHVVSLVFFVHTYIHVIA